MTDDELNQRFAQLAEAVSRVAEASTTGMQRLEEVVRRVAETNSAGIRRLDETVSQVAEANSAGIRRLEQTVSQVAEANSAGIRRLDAAHLKAMEEIGLVASILRQSIERDNEYRANQERVLAEIRQQQAEIHQRQAESDQRFETLLQEVRFLIRRIGEQPTDHNQSS